jgi:exopolyphosphatase/guanosine-5'-triphosphate,3'-diphosphate pyrophosphatase
VRRACIDIGSNTTRLLVAECAPGRVLEVHQERAFTRIGRELRSGGTIPQAKIDEVVQVVSAQLQSAHELGAAQVRGVATAAIRRAANGAELTSAVTRACGLQVQILSDTEEARLAFLGAAQTLDHVPTGPLGVVDVGGGSSELVVGRAPDRVSWSVSFGLGSGDLADRYLRSDPPSEDELSGARAEVRQALGGLEVPTPAEAVAVGGSASSLRRLAGPVLDREALTRSLHLLATDPATEVARRFALDLERVRLLPAGLLILQAASELFGTPLQIGRGGVREGVLLEGEDSGN